MYQLKTEGGACYESERESGWGGGNQESLSQGLFIPFLLCLDDVMKWLPGPFVSLKTLVSHPIPSPAIVSIEATMNTNLT